MNKKRILIPLYIIGHFAVDFACAFLLFHILYQTQEWYLGLLYYNFCAFALQMPLGLLADRWNHNSLCAALGCGMIALAYVVCIVGILPTILPVVIVAGIGNGLFHIGAGIDVLNVSKEKAYLLGIFVSPGALGIFLGTMLGKHNDLSIWIVLVALLVIAFSIMLAGYSQNRSFQSDNVPISFQQINSSAILIAIGCLLAVVCLRSYVGMCYNFSWKGQGAWGIILLLAVVLGKFSGGFLSDKMGVKKAAVLSLGFAGVLYLFSNNPFLGVAAVFLFNMTMPITLWAIARILKGCKGFSFGLLTFVLFLGFTPTYFEVTPFITNPTGLAIAAFGSLVLLWLGLHKAVV